MIIIRKNKPGYNAWLKRHNEKKFREVTNKRLYSKNKPLVVIKKDVVLKTPSNNYPKRSIHQVVAPDKFSVIDNPNETISFFNDVINTTNNQKKSTCTFFNIENITSLTIDSVMYLLALIKNIKNSTLKHYSFSGNFPKDKGINKLLNDSGFLNYVEVKNKKKIEASGKQLQIKSGKYINQSVAKEICDFVNGIFNTSIIYTKFLYNMIIELMTNTIQHAYHEKSPMVNYWYIFVNDKGDAIEFIFLDTGSGIPQTITKKFLEKSFLDKEDNEYIVSALRGEYRTQTKSGYRGKGLPKIYEYYNKKIINKLAIISGKGYCFLDNKVYDIEHTLSGTLFYWELNKKVNEEGGES